MQKTVAAVAVYLALSGIAAAQTPPPPAPAQPPPRPQPVQVMELSTPGWSDGGIIPAKFSQVGHDISPALAWRGAPENTQSFVVMVKDLDSLPPRGGDYLLHWLAWNIPKASQGLPEGVPQGAQLPDNMRQISMAGPNYKGPSAPPTGPLHHYLFEVYALDAALAVPAVNGQQPALTQSAVEKAMMGKVLGKGSLVGLFKRD
jgi:Raf kinase inhibitor-like YbhB/YbcL family protein